MGNKRVLPDAYQMKWGTASAGPFSTGPGAMASTNKIYSNIQNFQNFDNALIQFSWTGTPTGTIVVSVSNDGILFDDLILSPAIVQPAGSAGHWSVSLNQMPGLYFQVYYTNSSGTGSLTANIFQKDLN